MDIWGVKVWTLPLKRLVTLTTMLRYHAACDMFLLNVMQCAS